MALVQQDEFPTFANWEECVRWYQTNIGGNLYTTETHEPSILTRFVQSHVVARQLGALGRNENAARSNIIGQYIRSILMCAAPRLQGLWLLNSKLITYALVEIYKNDYDQIYRLTKGSKLVAATEKDELTAYKTASNKFRTALRSKGLLPPSFVNTVLEVEPFVNVDSTCFVALREMLTSMVAARAQRLNGQAQPANRQRIRGEVVAAAHYPEYYDFIHSRGASGLEGIADIRARTSGSEGVITTAYPEYQTRGGTVKKGPLLLTTAVMQYMRLTGKGEDYFSVDGVTDPHIGHAFLEMAQLVNGNAETSDYSQQCANMDILFNFYLHMRCMGVVAADMKKINNLCYNLGQKFFGREKIISLLS